MPRAVFIEHDGAVHDVSAPVGRSLMQVAVDNAVPGILGECGGACSCGTCHGHVDAAWLERLPPRSESESFMLEIVDGVAADSRLCCQIRMHDGLDGIVVRLPAEQG